MTVDPEKATVRGSYAGETVYFCSAACKKKYEVTHARD